MKLDKYIPEKWKRKGIKELSCGCVVERMEGSHFFCGHAWHRMNGECYAEMTKRMQMIEESSSELLTFDAEAFWEDHIVEGVM